MSAFPYSGRLMVQMASVQAAVQSQGQAPAARKPAKSRAGVVIPSTDDWSTRVARAQAASKPKRRLEQPQASSPGRAAKSGRLSEGADVGPGQPVLPPAQQQPAPAADMQVSTKTQPIMLYSSQSLERLSPGKAPSRH